MVAEDTELVALRAELETARKKIRVLESQLRALADHDPLTDLRNRQSMEQAIEDHLAGCVRYGPSGAFLLVGIDGLAELVASQGEALGDEVRVSVADGVRERLRTTDIVCRWADDELAVLLPRSTRHEVQVVANALLEVVSGRTDIDGVSEGLTASVGVAFVIAEEAADELVVRASMAMLAARRAGGSRTVVDSQRQSQLLWLSRARQRGADGTQTLK
jgi:diguanylate cyclase (GGDEF)-like protein